MSDNPLQSQKRNNPVQSTVKNICGAKTRSGKPCPTPPVKNRTRCRMHGGTNNGAPKGNKNAFKHGYYSKASIDQRSETHKLIREYRKLCRELNQL